MEALAIVVLLLGLAVMSGAHKLPASGWVYPVPDLQRGSVTYKATISSGFATPRTDAKGNAMSHRGVDVMYMRRGPNDLASEYPKGTASGSAMFFMPTGIPVFAARDGVVWSAGLTERGHAVVISHDAEADGKPFATFYQHMATLAIAPHAHGKRIADGQSTRIKAGAIIGIVGGDPLVKPSLRHLHFALWYGGTDESAIDPASAMAMWPHLVWKVKG